MDFGGDDDGLLHKVVAEKKAHLKNAEAILLPLFIVVAVIVFVLCFWHYEISLPFSIGITILVVPAMLFGVAFPVGYILGKRAARRLKSRIHDQS